MLAKSNLKVELVSPFVVSICGGNLRPGSIRANRRRGLRHIRESDRCGQTAKIEKEWTVSHQRQD